MLAAISACEKGGQWQEPLTLFHGMRHVQLQPNRVTLNALFDSPAIHDSLFARRVFQRSDLPEIRSLRECKASEIDLHDLSEGMAQIAIENWLSTAVAPKLEVKGSLTCRIVTGYGKSRKAWDTTDVRQRVLDLLRKLKLQASLFTHNPGAIRLVLSSKDLFKLQMIKEQTLGDVGGVFSSFSGSSIFGIYHKTLEFTLKSNILLKPLASDCKAKTLFVSLLQAQLC